jgi:hypothetical protein
MKLLKNIALGFVATATAVIASIISFQESNNVNNVHTATNQLDNNQSQLILENTQASPKVINEFTQIKELEKPKKPELIKVSTNTDGTIKVQIDKNLIKNSVISESTKSDNVPKTILPNVSIGIGEPAKAYTSDEYLEFLQLSEGDLIGLGVDRKSILGRSLYAGKALHISYGCIKKNFTSTDGICGRNKNMVNISKQDVLNGFRGDCTGDYETKAAIAYAKANNMSYLFYTPQNQTFTFERK